MLDCNQNNKTCISCKDKPDNYYEKINSWRELLKLENEMCNHRMTWFVLLEGLMFTAFGALFQKRTELNLDLYVMILSISGVLISISFLYIFLLGERAFAKIKNDHKEYCIANNIAKKDFDMIIGYDHEKKFLHILAPWNLMPIVLMLAWLGIFSVTFFIPVK